MGQLTDGRRRRYAAGREPRYVIEIHASSMRRRVAAARARGDLFALIADACEPAFAALRDDEIRFWADLPQRLPLRVPRSMVWRGVEMPPE